MRALTRPLSLHLPIVRFHISTKELICISFLTTCCMPPGSFLNTVHCNYCQSNNVILHWASKETYIFRAMSTLIYRIKINYFWFNVSYSPPHYACQKTKKSNKPKMRKMTSNHNKSNIKDHTNDSFPPLTTSLTSDIFNSGIRINCSRHKSSFWMYSYSTARKLRGVEQAICGIFEIGLVVI